MENASEALKIAFAVVLFTLALTLAISSFSSANIAVQEIIKQRDRENQYTYVEPTQSGNRIVGAETIVPTMYKAYRENIKIIFMEKTDEGEEPLPVYYHLNDAENRDGTINIIDLSEESFGNEGTKTATDVAIEHLEVILSGKDNGKYTKEIYYEDGFYKFLSENRFEERLGEYYQGQGASQIKKRVITYVLQPK